MSEKNTPDTPRQEAEKTAKQEPRRLSKSQQRQRRQSAFQYIAILFAAAFVLLLMAFMMEKRQFEAIQAENQEQIHSLQQSVSAVQSLQNLYDENAALKEKVTELEGQLQQSTLDHQSEKTNLLQQNDAQNRALQAMDWFWQIDEAYVRGRYSLCRSLIESLERQGLEEYLPTQSITDNNRYSPADRYREIRERLY